MPFPKFAVIRDNFDMFTLFGFGGFKQPVAIGDAQELKYVVGVTGNFFETLGVQAAAGRLFDPRDEKDSIADAAVISHALWRSAFGADAGTGRSEDRHRRQELHHCRRHAARVCWLRARFSG